jgi:hypothetical protein
VHGATTMRKKGVLTNSTRTTGDRVVGGGMDVAPSADEGGRRRPSPRRLVVPTNIGGYVEVSGDK